MDEYHVEIPFEPAGDGHFWNEPSDEQFAWLKTNIKNKWWWFNRTGNRTIRFTFTTREDAIAFKLVWG